MQSLHAIIIYFFLLFRLFMYTFVPHPDFHMIYISSYDFICQNYGKPTSSDINLKHCNIYKATTVSVKSMLEKNQAK